MVDYGRPSNFVIRETAPIRLLALHPASPATIARRRRTESEQLHALRGVNSRTYRELRVRYTTARKAMSHTVVSHNAITQRPLSIDNAQHGRRIPRRPAVGKTLTRHDKACTHRISAGKMRPPPPMCPCKCRLDIEDQQESENTHRTQECDESSSTRRKIHTQARLSEISHTY